MALLPPVLALAPPELVTPAPWLWRERKLLTWFPEAFDWPTVLSAVLPTAVAGPVVMAAVPCDEFVGASSPTSTGMSDPLVPLLVTVALLVVALPTALFPPVLALAPPELTTPASWLLRQDRAADGDDDLAEGHGRGHQADAAGRHHGHGRHGDAPRYRVIGNVLPTHHALPAQAAELLSPNRRDISGRLPHSRQSRCSRHGIPPPAARSRQGGPGWRPAKERRRAAGSAGRRSAAASGSKLAATRSAR